VWEAKVAPLGLLWGASEPREHAHACIGSLICTVRETLIDRKCAGHL